MIPSRIITHEMQPQLLIACDFDGTVTRQDTLVQILDLYGSPTWRQVQEKVVSGEMSIREGLQAEMGSVQANLEEMTHLLSTRVELDPTFPSFLRAVRAKGIPLVVLSGGFDLCVQTVLKKAGLWPVPYLSNRLTRNGRGWHVEFPYPSERCGACGHCKGDPVRAWKTQGYTTVFVGNGVTDRCAAQEAALTFAKDELSDWCRTQGISTVSYSDFNDVHEKLKEKKWL